MSKEVEFTWSEEEFSLQSFLDRFSHRLPLVVNVTEGWAGIDDCMHTIGNEEVRTLIIVELSYVYVFLSIAPICKIIIVSIHQLL